MRMIFMVFIVQIIFLTGCMNSEKQSVADFLAQVKQEKNAKISELPKVQEYKSIDYDVLDLRSPFQLYPEFMAATDDNKTEVSAVQQQARPDANRKKELLENYSLDSISMVGVIKKGKTFWGIVRDKTGIIHRVHVGNYLGENSGRIEEITDKNIHVKELIADGQGGWTARFSSLSLAK